MPRYFIPNDDQNYLIVLGDDLKIHFHTEVFELQRDFGVETDIIEEEEQIIEPEKTSPEIVKAPKKQKKERVKRVETEAEKKERKRIYMRKYMQEREEKKRKEKGTVVDLKVPATNDMNYSGTPATVKKESIPLALISEYGRTAVEVILSEKNRGIGYTADEIYEMRDKRLSHLSLMNVEDVYERLVQVGL